jgi:hypothetical protein
MTWIRMTDGRDRGHAREMNFPDAQEMLAKGQAVPVDFNEPDALGFRELPTANCQLPTSDVSPRPSAETIPTPAASHEPESRKPEAPSTSLGAGSSRKPAAGKRR